MIAYYEKIDSTNRVAKELALQGAAAGTVIQARQQDAGRGQHGRSFASPPGGLYFTLLLEPDLQTEQLSLVTLATGLACLEVIAASFALSLRIKWPNDLYLDGKKLAGILCENLFITEKGKSQAKVLVGIGINVNSTAQDFPPELRGMVTSIYEHRQQQTDLQALLARLIAAIRDKVMLLRHNQTMVLEQWQDHDYLQGRPLIYNSPTLNLHGTGVGLDMAGRYCFIDEQGRQHAVIGGQLRPADLD